MKRAGTVILVLIVVAVLAVPVFAHRGGWGGGWMHGSGHGWRGGGSYADLTDDQRADLNKLEENLFAETSKLRNEIWTKSEELDIALNASEPDTKKVKKLQGEISDLTAKLAEKRID